MKKFIKSNIIALILFLNVINTGYAVDVEDIFQKYQLKYEKESQQTTYNKAYQFFKEGKYLNSIKNLEELSKEKPDQAVIYDILGNLYSLVGSIPQEIEAYNKAIQLDGNLKSPYFHLLSLYLEVKNYNEAITLLNKYLIRYPSDEEAIYQLAQLEGLNTNYELAITNFKKLINSSKYQTSAYKGMGLAYKKLNDVPNAINYYKLALMNEEDPELLNDIGLIYIDNDYYAKANEYFARANTLSSENPTYLYNLALTNIELHDYDQASTCLNKILNLYNNDSKAITMLTYISSLKQKPKEKIKDNSIPVKTVDIKLNENTAIKFFPDNLTDNKAIQIEENSGIVAPNINEKIKIPIDEGNKQHKFLNDIEIENKIDVQKADTPEVPIIEPEIKTKEEEIATSTETKKSESITLDEKSVNPRLNPIENMVLLEKLSLLRPGNNKILYNLGASYYKNNEFEKAISTLQKVLEGDANNSDAKNLLIASYIKTKEFRKAKALLYELLPQNSNTDELLNQLGYVHYNLQEYIEAANAYRQAINNNPNNLMSRMLLALTYEKMENYSGEIEQFNEILRMDPTNTRALQGLATVSYIQKKYDNAISYFEQLIINVPEDKENYYYLENLYIKQLQYDKAEEVMYKMINKFPGEAQAYYYLANVYAKKGNTDMALENYKKTIEIDPNNPIYHYFLGVTYIEKGENNKAWKEVELLKTIDAKYSLELEKLLK